MPDHKNLAEALAAFQAEIPTIAKGNTAKVKTKTGSDYSYEYADLTDITKVALPLLAAHGLSFTAAPTLLPDTAIFALEYKLMHASGESVGGLYPLHNGAPQDVGSAITYARRYALCAVTGIAPGGDDDDAQAAQSAPERAAQAVRTRQDRSAEQTTVKTPSDWQQQINDAPTDEALRALYQRAVSEGWLTDEVMSAVNIRKRALDARAKITAPEPLPAEAPF